MRFSIVYVADFGAWALRYLEPSARGRDLLVQAGGKVVARSEGLRSSIELGWDIERARAQALEAMVRPHSGSRTRLAWEALLDALNERTPWLEAIADGSYLPAAGQRARERAMGVARGARAGLGGSDALLLAHARSQGIGVAAARFFDDADAAELASSLELRVGIAEDRPTAMLAAASAPPGMTQVVPLGREADFRADLPLIMLERVGISHETVERLFWLGFTSVGSVARLTERQVIAQFDDGRALYELVHGIGYDPVGTFQAPPRIEAAFNAEQPLSEPAEYEPVLQHLLLQALETLEEREAQLVSVHLTSGTQTWAARRIAHEPTSDFRTLSTLARIAAREAREEARRGGSTRGQAHVPPRRGIPLPDPPLGRDPLPESPEPGLDVGVEVAFDRIVLILGGLRRPRPFQEVLWKERSSVRKAIEEVETRFPGSGMRWVARDPDAYLPEEAYELASAVTPVGARDAGTPKAGARKAGSPKGAARASAAPRKTSEQPRRVSRRNTGGTIRHDGSVAVDDPSTLMPRSWAR